MQPWHYWKNDPFKAWIFSGHFSSSRDGTRIFQSGSSYPHVWSNWGPKYFGWVSKSWRPSPKKFFLLLLVRSDWQITVTLSTKLYCLSLENINFRHVRNKSRSLKIFASTHERVLLSSFCAILTNHRPSILFEATQTLSAICFTNWLCLLLPFSWLVGTWPIKRQTKIVGAHSCFPDV